MTSSALTKETATEYDFIALLDASGSMGEKSKRFPDRTRWQEGQESIVATARAIEQFDADGLTLVTFGPGVTVQDGVTSTAVSDIFASRGPRGSTPLHDALQVVADKHKASGKKVVAFCFTDGVPDDPNKAATVINDLSNSLNSEDEVMIIFVQIGDDDAARKYLDKLDDQLSGKFDIVAVASLSDADNFDPLDLINRAITTRAI